MMLANASVVNGSGPVIAVISAGIGLGGLIRNRRRVAIAAVWIVQTKVAGVRSELLEGRSDMSRIRKRMAWLEGLFTGFTKMEAAR